MEALALGSILCGLDGLREPSPTGKLYDEANEEQFHAIKRAAAAVLDFGTS